MDDTSPYLMQALKRRERREVEPADSSAGYRQDDSFYQGMRRRFGTQVGRAAKQIAYDAVEETPRALRSVAENIVPPLAIINSLRDPKPREQAELTQGPVYGAGTSDPGAYVMAMAAGLVGPGKGPKRVLPSGQKELPGMRTSSAHRSQQAQADLDNLRDSGQSFASSDPIRPYSFGHNIDTQGQDYFSVRDTLQQMRFDDGSRVEGPGPGGREFGNYRQNLSLNQTPGYENQMGVELRERGLGNEYNEAMDRLERLDAARRAVPQARGVAAGDERARLSAQVRALRSEMPSDIAGQNRQLEEMLRLTRAKPIISESKEVYRFDKPSGGYTREGDAGAYFTQYDMNADPSTRIQHGMVEQALRGLIPARREARMLEEFLSEDPRRAQPDTPQWIQALTRDPDVKSARESAGVFKEAGHPDATMPPTTREAADEFLKASRKNEALFQYGLAPDESKYDMEMIAAHHAKAANKRVTVDYDGYESDEPYKIERPKEHGRGEAYRDRHGDYVMQEHERGDYPMYDDEGNVIKHEVKGPPTREQFEAGENPKAKTKAEGGETVRDEYGDSQFAESEGGEYMRDDRGRIKKEEVENPDYSESTEGGSFNLSIPREGNISYNPDTEHIHATEAGGKGAGQLLYQIANSYAVRNKLNIGSAGLTRDNQYRLLGNQLSTVARHGRNPRDLSETLAGDRPHATEHSRTLYPDRHDPRRNQSTGFDIWNAEVGEGEARLLRAQEDPGRVAFTGEGFTLDGKRVSIKDIDAQIRAGNLNPDVGQNKVGAKSWARIAVLKYLEQATPQMARQLAQDWPKELGPLFASVAGATPLIRALRSGQEPENAD